MIEVGNIGEGILTDQIKTEKKGKASISSILVLLFFPDSPPV